MASANLTKSNVIITQKSSTTEVAPPVDPRDASFVAALSRRIKEGQRSGESGMLEVRWSGDLDEVDGFERLTLESCNEVKDRVTVKLLAQGGYNDVWLVECGSESDDVPNRFVLRMPNADSLKPYQIRNEVGWLRYMAENYPIILVPKVYAYCDGASEDDNPFVAEEFIEGIPLSEAWKSYSELEKNEVAHKIAEVVVQLGEIRFDAIGSMQPNGTLGPTVEGVKLFRGRDAFHGPECYDIGPYASIEQYVVAYYNKEIYYYSNAPDSDFDDDAFELESRADFVKCLGGKRASVEAELQANSREEPFVLCHGDLQGRNFMMQGTNIAAVIDWEFAGSFPLSELVDSGVEVLEMDDEESTDECFKWCDKICRLTEQIARERKWPATEVELLMSEGDPIIQGARVEMLPEYSGGLETEDTSEEDSLRESGEPN